MTLPNSGTITMAQINTELERSANAPINLNDPVVRGLAQRHSGTISMSDFYGKTYVSSVGLTGYTLPDRYCIDTIFNDHERRHLKCVLTVSRCKIGGGDRNTGSLYSAKGDWHNLLIRIVDGSGIYGSGGNGGAGINSGCGAGQTRTDGGHAITFVAGSNARVTIDSGCTVAGGGAGGQSGWYTPCGYTNSGTGGAGGGGAGYPAGIGGPNGSQDTGKNCYCSTSNRGANGTLTGGGECGYATGWGNGCPSGSTVSAQHGSRGGALGQKAQRTDGCYPISAHGNGGSAVVNAKSVRSDDDAQIFGLINGRDARNFNEDDAYVSLVDYSEIVRASPRITHFVAEEGSDVATIPMYGDYGDVEYNSDEIYDCPECPSVEVSDLV